MNETICDKSCAKHLLSFHFVLFFYFCFCSVRLSRWYYRFKLSSDPFQTNASEVYSGILFTYPNMYSHYILVLLCFFISQFFLLFSLRCRRRKDGKRETSQEGTHTSNAERTTTASPDASATNNNGCRVAELERKVNLGLVIRFIAFYILIQILLEWSGHIFRVSFSQTFGFCRRRRQFAWLLLVSCTFCQRKMCWFSLMNADLACTLCERVCAQFRIRPEKKGLLFPVCWFVFFLLSPLASSPHVPLRMVTLSKPLSAWWHLKYTDFVPKFTFPF